VADTTLILAEPSKRPWYTARVHVESLRDLTAKCSLPLHPDHMAMCRVSRGSPSLAVVLNVSRRRTGKRARIFELSPGFVGERQGQLIGWQSE
jgi:hypothetical protein